MAMQFGVPEEEFRPGGNYMADSAGDSPNKARGVLTYLPWHSVYTRYTLHDSTR